MSTILQALLLAQRHHQAGQLREAEQLYRQVLQVDPRQADALHLLGVIALQGDNQALALDYISQALRLKPHHAEAHNNLGVVLCALGRPEEAAVSWREALRLNPQLADAHNNLGHSLSGQGQLAEAVGHLEQALRLRPDYAEAHHNLGRALNGQGRLAEAVGHFEQALRLRPDYAEAHSDLGIVLWEQGRLEEAAASYHRALGLKPQFPEAHNNLGIVLRDQGRLAEAEASYRQALRLKPDYAEAHNNLAVALKEQNRPEEAVAHYEQALRLKPDYAGAHNNLANTLREQGRLGEAVAHYEQALRLKPDYAEAHNNLATTLKDSGRLAEAVAHYEQALRLKPDYAEAHTNLGIARLLLGDFERGWPEYEWRWRREPASAPAFRQPPWDGSDLRGKTILLHEEQGRGDTLHFVRYAPLVKQRGGTVLLRCRQPLLRLLQTCAGIDRLAAPEAGLPPFDVHAALLSLPRLFNTALATIPADVPYLSADPELVGAWRRDLGGLDGFSVGIAWQGSTAHKEDRWRSVPLAQFAPLARLGGVRLVSLQTGYGAEQLAALPDRESILDLGPRLADFADTAAVMKNLDLVVTVDTAVAHLAGALGVPAWVAVPFAPDWRWLTDRPDSPWYPTLRLFRQREFGNWADVFATITGELERLVAAPRPPRPGR
jgi:tetratricopeptide (TPR) repeat protein